MSSKGTPSFDFIKRNVIRKLGYTVIYIGGLIMFSEIWEQGFLKLVGSIVNTIERIQEKEYNQYCSVFTVLNVHSVHSVHSVHGVHKC